MQDQRNRCKDINRCALYFLMFHNARKFLISYIKALKNMRAFKGAYIAASGGARGVEEALAPGPT